MTLRLETPAQERFAEDVLAWGQPRPRWPTGRVDELRHRLELAVNQHRSALERVAATRPTGRLSVGRKVLERRVCDGWQRDPVPFAHSWSSVRATLARDAIAAEWLAPRASPAAELVARVWHEAASRRPGDPASRSAWMNRRTSAEAASLGDEVAALVEDVREVWPPLVGSPLTAVVRRPLELPLGGGVLTMFGVPDLVLDSPADDDRARALVVDLRTGAPNPGRDRASLRFHALLVTLVRGRPPFRWISYHVTEGRSEPEDLTLDALQRAVDAIVEVVAQLARLADGGAERLVAGRWCADCQRQDRCEVAARMEPGGPGEMSHPSAMLDPSPER